MSTNNDSSPPPLKYFTLTHPLPHIAHLSINRPSKLNAISPPMWPELRTAFDHLSTNPDTRCILFSGTGPRAFTAGLDLTAASSSDSILTRNPAVDPARHALHFRHHALDIQDCVSAISRCTKPVIALMHGICYGAALDLACAADIRLCTKDARLCVKEVDIGIAADLGTLSRLPKVLGGVTSFCKEVCLTAREFSGEEALRNNLVSEAVEGGRGDLVKRGLEVAGMVARKSPVAVVGTKHLLDEGWERSVEDGLRYTAVWNAGMSQTSDVGRAVKGTLGKRVPTFEKL
ncbi:MAG: hypothetical protein Q9227_001455 [Pyrenula ochraceoflavens]